MRGVNHNLPFTTNSDSIESQLPTSLTFNRHLYMPPANTTAAINEFKATLSEEVPLCTGIVPLGANISQLFYRNTADGTSGCALLFTL